MFYIFFFILSLWSISHLRLDTFQVLSSPVCLVAIMLDSTDLNDLSLFQNSDIWTGRGEWIKDCYLF